MNWITVTDFGGVKTGVNLEQVHTISLIPTYRPGEKCTVICFQFHHKEHCERVLVEEETNRVRQLLHELGVLQ